MNEEAYTPGPYFVRKRAGHAYVDNVNARNVADCGDVAFSSSEPDADRIALALTCHDALLAACEFACEYYEMLERATGVEHGVLVALRAAIALAKGGKSCE